MAVGLESTTTVDIVSTNATKDVVTLTIIGPDEWPEGGEDLLRRKIESYLTFVHSGQLYETFPDTIGMQVEFAIYAEAMLPTFIQAAVRQIADRLRADFGIGLVLAPQSSSISDPQIPDTV